MPSSVPAPRRRGGRVNVPVISSNVARRGNALTRAIGTVALRLTGWRFSGEPFPDLRKFVLIVAPHTSNWDFIVGIMAMYALGIRGTFLGKDTLFKFPLGLLMRFLGGFPVDRASKSDVVTQTAELAARTDRIILALSPEGTRKRVEKWRTGFYWIARKAELPILPVAFDYARKEVRVFPLFETTGDQERDFAVLRACYEPSMARYPEKYAP